MTLTDIHRLLVEMLEGGPHVTAAFIMGILFTSVVLLLVYFCVYRRRIHPDIDGLKRDLEQQKTVSATFLRMAEERDAKIVELSRDCVQQKEALADVDEQRGELEAQLAQAKKAGRRLKRKAIAVRDRYKHQVDAMLRQLRELEHLQGRFWETPAGSPPPPFGRLLGGHAPIIATFNLKGGVGKTSLTAHLGAALWAAGKKVLLVDLDYQASLSHLVLTPEQIKDLKHGCRYVDQLLTTSSDPGQETWNLATPIASTNSYVLAAREKLGDVEEMMKAAWLIGASKREPRYTLRAALHSDLVRRTFDYILIDCPPRLSTACVNALTACDFVLVPTLFDKTSRDAVGRLCQTLRHFVSVGLCPDLQILGIVGNKAFRTPSLTINESNHWNQIKRDAADSWEAPVYLFDRHLPALKAFAEATETRALADQSIGLSRIFAELARELEEQISKRIMHHAESPGLATVR